MKKLRVFKTQLWFDTITNRTYEVTLKEKSSDGYYVGMACAEPEHVVLTYLDADGYMLHDNWSFVCAAKVREGQTWTYANTESYALKVHHLDNVFAHNEHESKSMRLAINRRPRWDDWIQIADAEEEQHG